MSFSDWQNDPARLRQLLHTERIRTGKLRAEIQRIATLADALEREIAKGNEFYDDQRGWANATRSIVKRLRAVLV